MTEQDEFGWIASRNLTAEFAPNRTARARDKNAFAFESLPHFFIIHADGIAAQQIGDVHFAQTTHIHFAADQFIKSRHRARWNPLYAANVIDHPHDSPRRGGNGDDDFVNLLAVQNAGEFINFADDRHAVNFVTLFGGVVVEEANGDEINQRGFLQLAHNQRARVSRADNQCAFRFSVAMLRGLLRENPQRKARAADEDERKQPVNAQRGARHSGADKSRANQKNHHARS